MNEFPKMLYPKGGAVDPSIRRGVPGDSAAQAGRLVRNAVEEKAALKDGYAKPK